MEQKFSNESVDKLLNDVHERLMKMVVEANRDPVCKVIDFKEPDELSEIIGLNFTDEGSDHEKILQLVEKTIQYSAKVGNPRFINQLYSGCNPYGLIGQWVVETLNPSLYTFEVSPVFVLVENQVIKEMCRILGYDAKTSDGLFAPGGSVSTIYGASIARFHKAPSAKSKGLSQQPRLVAFCSEYAHYCVEKACVLLGIGKDNVVLVKCDDKFRMEPSDLENKLQQTIADGGLPFLVVATAGTTVHGAFDPIEQVGEIAQRYSCWFHVDAAWGGGLLMSKKHRGILKGIEKADSAVWNPHKLLGAPQQCSAFLTRHGEILQEAHAANANYLFQPDKFYDNALDPGDKTLQCGRKVDSYKFWLMWKAVGNKGLEQHVDYLMDLTGKFQNLIENHPNFQLVCESSCTNVCFWYLPPSLNTEENIAMVKAKRERSNSINQDTGFWLKLDKVAPKIKERMVRKGSMMITYTREGNDTNFFRFVLQNSEVTDEHLHFFVDEIHNLGKDL